MYFDVAVIGAGAAGMCCAIRLKQNNPNLSVCLIEQLSRVGKKLITTGNGRCNITNKNISYDRYHGEDVSFCHTALTKYTNKTAEDFFLKLGILFTYDIHGRAYPYSLQASSVVDVMRFSAEELKIQIFTETKVTDIKKHKTDYEIICENTSFKSKNIVIASGLYSGGEKLGSNGSVLKILKDKGYKTSKLTPAIVQLKTEPSLVRSLKGIKIEGTATLLKNGKPIKKESGEILFCDYGLSGPPILQISRETERNNAKFEVSLDLMPDYTAEQLKSILNTRISNLKNRPAEEFFTGLLNKRVGQLILKNCGVSFADKTAVIEKKIDGIIKYIKDWRFEVKSTTGFINSQVTAGGLLTSQFENSTMMSKKDRGLYAIGEILDIDGDCGGFNLQWAWSSALICADSITGEFK